MNIDRVHIHNQGIDNHPTVDRTGGPQKQAAGGQVERGGTEDSVALSSRAREIDRLSAIAGEDRTARMERIKAAIENGTYDVSGEQIAKSMIAANKK